jgi:hypothetical protein
MQDAVPGKAGIPQEVAKQSTILVGEQSGYRYHRRRHGSRGADREIAFKASISS